MIANNYTIICRISAYCIYTAALSEAMQASTEDRFIMGSSNKKRQIRVQLNPEPKNQPKAKAEEGKEGK